MRPAPQPRSDAVYRARTASGFDSRPVPPGERWKTGQCGFLSASITDTLTRLLGHAKELPIQEVRPADYSFVLTSGIDHYFKPFGRLEAVILPRTGDFDALSARH